MRLVSGWLRRAFETKRVLCGVLKNEWATYFSGRGKRCATVVEVVALGEANVKPVLGACQSDIKETQFFFDLSVVLGRHVRRDVAVGCMNDEDLIPFQTFGRVDCAEDQVIFVEHRIAGQVLCRRWWIERDVDQETAAVRKSRGGVF